MFCCFPFLLNLLPRSTPVLPLPHPCTIPRRILPRFFRTTDTTCFASIPTFFGNKRQPFHWLIRMDRSLAWCFFFCFPAAAQLNEPDYRNNKRIDSSKAAPPTASSTATSPRRVSVTSPTTSLRERGECVSSAFAGDWRSVLQRARRNSQTRRINTCSHPHTQRCVFALLCIVCVQYCMYAGIH